MKDIKQNELTFQLMVEASPNALILVNNLGKIAYLNYFAETLFKYNKQELIGQDLIMLLPESFKQKHPSLIDSYLKNPLNRQMGTNRELYARRKDGTEFPAEIGLNPIVTVDGVLVLAAIIDISQRKRANEQFRLVVESAPNAIVLVNNIGEISLVNKQTEVLFGYRREELIGSKMEVLLPTHLKEKHPSLRAMFMSNPQTRPMGAGRDLYAKRKDGSEFPVEIGLNPIETIDGSQVLASIIDISERKRIDEAFRIHAKKIEDKNKELEQFAYIASHDLQEPLNTIINYIGLLNDNCNNELNEVEEMSFKFLNQASHRMKELIKGLLDYSRLGERAKIKKVDCNILVKSVCEDLSSLLERTNAKIHLEKLPIISAFELELRLLFQNLISNAIKFVKPNVVPEIFITAKDLRSQWEFAVKDNGIGIDLAYKERIFTIFQRLHGRDEYEGTGIGLAHCRKIVELHEGEIWIESQLDVGSTFFFSINKNIEL